MTAALVEQGTLRIDDYRASTGPTDRVELDNGELYSDKPPGQPFFAVPFFAAARVVGIEDATVPRYRGNLGVWWVIFWSSVAPVAVLVVLMFEAARRFNPGTAAWAALSMWVGTLWLVFSTNLYGHALSTLAAFGAWLVLADHKLTAPRAALAGLLVGLAVTVEYQVALVGVILAGYIAMKAARQLVWYVLGGIPGVLAILLYHQIAFGNAFQNPYAIKAASEKLPGDDPTLGIPKVSHLFQIFFGTRGLIFTAIVLVGLAGLVWIIRGRRPGYEHAWVGLAVFVAFLMLQSGWPNPWGGEQPGPRYLLPAIPWLAVPVAAVWTRRSRLCWVVTGVGAAFMSLAVMAQHVIPEGWSFLRWYPTVIREEGFSPTIFTMAAGRPGLVVQAIVVATAVVFLVKSTRALAAAERSV
jgi:hypothetical protein